MPARSDDLSLLLPSVLSVSSVVKGLPFAAYSRSYFAALPFDFATGYFAAFASIFASVAA